MPRASHFGPPRHWKDFDTHLKITSEFHSFKEWETAQRNGSNESRVDEFAQLLTLVLIFLADGNATKKTMGARAWVLLYAIRPDLIQGESMTHAAKEFGYATEMSLVQYLDQLREAVPALRIDTNSRRGLVGADERTRRSENSRAAAFRNWDARRRLDRLIDGS